MTQARAANGTSGARAIGCFDRARPRRGVLSDLLTNISNAKNRFDASNYSYTPDFGKLMSESDSKAGSELVLKAATRQSSWFTTRSVHTKDVGVHFITTHTELQFVISFSFLRKKYTQIREITFPHTARDVNLKSCRRYYMKRRGRAAHATTSDRKGVREALRDGEFKVEWANESGRAKLPAYNCRIPTPKRFGLFSDQRPRHSGRDLCH
ncbi:hypothetical protein EVAR_17988_1 [Eumeta japonica]|uniref:Uncharacterized protein n=1 Tax=Eumeta variegata TaxID=151549 RepID=A0A4C1Y9R0_EUMVA|nr:hypothetical protein EVAR_17988_1 [Eumeta japonica]